MKVRLLVLGEVPPGLAGQLLSGLPRPFVAGLSERGELPGGTCWDPRRAQADAVCVLETLPAPESGWLLIAVTSVDLFIEPLAYVFGLSALGERRGVVSWARLRPEEERPDALDIFARRLRTEVAHELGHAAGLIHCVVPECAMHRSLWPEQVDLKRPEYCPACLAGLGTARDGRGAGFVLEA